MLLSSASRHALLAFATALCLSGPVHAQSIEPQLARLYADQRWDNALALVDAQLLRQPGDVQMQIQRGVILTNLNRSAEALVAFRKVTAEHPELPGPHNNVAVLLAAKGDFEAARESLERAIRTHPSYAAAYENLGDLYAHMAADAYRRALRYDKQPASARPKLALVNGLGAPSGMTPAQAVASAAPAASRQVAPLPSSRLAQAQPVAPAIAVLASKPTPTPASAPSMATKPASAPTVLAAVKSAASAPIAVAKPVAKPTEVAAAPPAKPAVASTGQTVDAQRPIALKVGEWARAWSQRDMNGYFAAYTPAYKGKAKSRADWQTERQDRIRTKNRIDVTVSDIKIKVTGTRAEARFIQTYESDALRTVSPKILVFEQVGGKWLIQQETVGR